MGKSNNLVFWVKAYLFVFATYRYSQIQRLSSWKDDVFLKWKGTCSQFFKPRNKYVYDLGYDK